MSILWSLIFETSVLSNINSVHIAEITMKTWWRHQMETFSALLAFCEGIHRSPVTSPHKDQLHGALLFSLICAWINTWVNNGEAGDLRRHRAHYWPAHRAGLLRCNFFGQPGSVSKFPPFLWVKLWVGWVGRGYIEISGYFPALWINRVTLVTKIKLWYSLGY